MSQQHCPNCGAPFTPGDTFCEICGAPLAPQTPQRPGGRKSRRGLITIISIVCAVLVLGGAAFFVVDHFRNAEESSVSKEKDDDKKEEDEELSAKEYLKLGNDFLDDGDYDEAVDAFSDAIKQDKKLFDAYVGRGDAYFELEKYSKAIKDYEKALELDDDDDVLEKLDAAERADERNSSASASAPPVTDAATSESPATSAETSASPSAAAPVPVDISAAVFYYDYSDVYTSMVRIALDRELNALGIRFQNYDGKYDPNIQNIQIDTAIAQGVNLLIVNIVASGNEYFSQQIIDRAGAADIPVIFFNRALAYEGEDKAVLGSYDKLAFVGTDMQQAGHMQGTMIGDYLLANYGAVDLNGDGKISYAMFMGDETNPEAIYRTQFAVEDADAKLTAAGLYALEYFNSDSSNKYQVDLNGAWSAQAAMEYMITNLSLYSESNGNMIELIICNNDGMAEGAISALNVAGYNFGGGTTIPVFGIDATDAAEQLINDGRMTGTIRMDAEGMAKCVAFLVGNVKNGGSLMDATGSFNIAKGYTNKILIPYVIVSK